MKRIAMLTVLAIVAGCSESETKRERYEGTVDLEVSRLADVVVEREEGDRARVSITLREEGYGLAPHDVVIAGTGTIERFPEASTSMITARLAAAAQAAGPCGDKPVSLALTLVRRGDAARVAGGLAAYCGEGVFHGKPARILRLAGSLPRR